MERVVIVGGGKAGTRVAQELRSLGHTGSITLFDAQRRLPYDRPPLSKDFLVGKIDMQALTLHADAFYPQQSIDLRLGTTISEINRNRRVVIDSTGTETGYDTLVLAMGAVARRMSVPGVEQRGLHYLRTADEAETLGRALRSANDVLIVGAGFIGLEVAASAKALGRNVIVVEQSSVALGRSVPASMAVRVMAEHRRRGVEVCLNVSVERLTGDGAIDGAVLSDGRRVACDLVIVGIGATPATDLAAAAGLAVQDGIVVDAQLRTTDPAIYALGDVCRFPDRAGTGTRRLESWRNADEQACSVAQTIMQSEQPFSGIPYFWSDQFGSTLQVVGEPAKGQQIVARALRDDAVIEFSLDYASRIVGAAAFGGLDIIGRDVRVAEHLIRRAIRVDAMQLSDPATSLKNLLKN
jgi:3-phenylpropionate/trans-cinnamate dioxygenase ferredoxin reductase component